MKNYKTNKFKPGGVSMFVVIAACLLSAVIIASFVRLALRDQGQASLQDISQSAYDSAQAGVEDAKIFLNKYNQECDGGSSESTECVRMRNALAGESCNMLYAGGIGSENGETLIQTSLDGSDESLDQAYTCVRIERETTDFLGNVSADQAHMVPLQATQRFNRVRLSWYLSDDRNVNTTNAVTLDNVAIGTNPVFTDRDTWNDVSTNPNKPPVMKAQFFGFSSGGSISLDQLDESFADNGSGLDERIYFPARGTGASSTDNLPNAARRTSSTRTMAATPVTCQTSLASGGYACTVTVNLQHYVEPGSAAWLRLTSIYSSSSFKVEMLDGSSVISFDGVQPKVDSTGRANDAFRRVESRIEFADPNFPVPDFAVQTEDPLSPLCKTLWVTNTRNGNLECSAQP